ncbi:BPTD_2524 family lipoprotein [Paracandidimonas lactea]|uniref:BPTD_2524 family lipoprotein n=1 Tax=Paracandidimonas lactea TaxID=2895524 RepID=UPI001F268111|nr:hypothetical protein [Paracandidimonas lactea]
MVKALVSAMAVALLAGCAGGIKSGDDSPSITYVVPRSYQIVYLRVQNQAGECLRAKNQYDVYASVDGDRQKGSVVVKGMLGTLEVARTDIEAIDKNHTRVRHTVWGRAPWDGEALQAMRQSVLMDTSVCSAYR